MTSSFRLVVAASVRVWPVPAVPAVLKLTLKRWRPLEEVAAAASPTVRQRYEVVEFCPVPAVPAVPSTRRLSPFGGTYSYRRRHPIRGGAARWA